MLPSAGPQVQTSCMDSGWLQLWFLIVIVVCHCVFLIDSSVSGECVWRLFVFCHCLHAGLQVLEALEPC